MSFTRKDRGPAYVEAMVAPPIYHDGVGPVTIVRGMVHMTLIAEQPTVDGSGGTERIVVARLVISPKNLRQAMGDVRTALNRFDSGDVTVERGEAHH